MRLERSNVAAGARRAHTFGRRAPSAVCAAAEFIFKKQVTAAASAGAAVAVAVRRRRRRQQKQPRGRQPRKGADVTAASKHAIPAGGVHAIHTVHTSVRGDDQGDVRRERAAATGGRLLHGLLPEVRLHTFVFWVCVHGGWSGG
eukprot:165876-Chlamydomonas_euryale.AAC.1